MKSIATVFLSFLIFNTALASEIFQITSKDGVPVNVEDRGNLATTTAQACSLAKKEAEGKAKLECGSIGGNPGRFSNRTINVERGGMFKICTVSVTVECNAAL
jgi:hypothetical protein